MGALSGTSISLPKMGGAGKLCVSPLKSGEGRFGPAGKSKLTEMMDVPMRMVGRASGIATWNLRMQGEGGKVRKYFQNKDGVREVAKGRTGRAECVDRYFEFLFVVD
jgi:hypothetical protein